MLKMKMPELSGINGMTESAACLFFITRYYDKNFEAGAFNKICGLQNDYTTLPALSRVAEKAGFRTRCVQLTSRQLKKDVLLPCMLQDKEGRFFVLLRVSGWKKNRKMLCFYPAGGYQTYTSEQFDQLPAGMALLLEPGFQFRARKNHSRNILSWGLLLQYFRRRHWQISKLAISFLVTSLVQLIFPFLMQSVVDVGINTSDLNFVTIVLLAQLMLVVSRISVEFIRGRLLLHTSTTLNLSILSDFWIKLTHLPLAYFDRQHTGKILQNINDNRQVQTFLTGSALNTLYSMLNFIVLIVVLMMLKLQLFFIFLAGVLLYLLWMRLFFRIRKKINYQIFHASARENNLTLQMVQGMQEMRLQNIEQVKRWEWEGVKADIFKMNFRNLDYNQIQKTGVVLINQSKDVLLTFLVARSVIDGQLTIGAMLAVQYIIGQLNGPVEQFIGFIQSAQDAKISMDRLNDVHQLKEEEEAGKDYQKHLPACRTLYLQNISFTYEGNEHEPVLKNIDIQIPEGKTTAIVGMSGSGKTTLLKILLKFYHNYEGSIKVGDTDFSDISPSFWRRQCGAVMQDSYIFNDTIAANIAPGLDMPDHEKLKEACRIANILNFIESLPQQFNTRIGSDGTSVSQGQKQRLLIARTIYKDPAYLFLDESTNALDARNERHIIRNIQPFLKNKTVVIVAHRLSTVMHADNIIVMDRGQIIEQGDHYRLSSLKGEYFRLVKDQLELDI